MCRQFSSRAVRLGDRGFDRNFFLLAKGDHLAAAGKPLAELFDPPRGDHLHCRGRAPRPPVESGTDRSPCRSPRGRKRRPPPRGPPAGRLWRSAAGRSTCPAGRCPRTSPATAAPERRSRGRVLPGRRRSAPTPPRTAGPCPESPRDPRTAAPDRRRRHGPRSLRPAASRE